MISEMAYFFLAILCVAFILALIMTFIGTTIFPFLRTSRQEVRDLFLALEDLTWPMGSFPTRLLQLWTSELSQLLPMDLTCEIGENSTSDFTTKATPEDINEGKIGQMTSIPRQPYIVSPSFEREGLDAEAEQDELFFDTFAHQLHQIDTRISGVEGCQASEAVEDATEIFFDANQETENEHTTPISTNEAFRRISADLSRMATEKETLEAYIRQAVDPKGSHGLATMSLDSLVRWMMQDHEQSMNSTRLDNTRRDDEIYDAKQAFEAIIIGQNLAMQHKDHEMGLAIEQALRLNTETLGLRKELENTKAKLEKRKEKWNRQLESAQRDADGARSSAEEATSGVESRIRQLKQQHVAEMSAAAFKSLQERNSIICSRNMVQDALNNARRQVDLDEEEHRAALKESDQTNRQLCATIKELRLRLAASEELSASTEQRLRKRLDDQSKEKDHEIGSLRDKLRDLSHETSVMRRSELSAEQESHRLSVRLQQQTASFHADKKRIEDRANRDIACLRRTIATDQVIIDGLVEDLKSGGEVQELMSQLEDSKEQLQKSAKDTQFAKKQLQDRKREIKNLRETIKARDKKIKQDAEISSTEMENLKKQLEQALRVSDSRLEEEARKLKEQEQWSSRKFEMEKKEAVETANRKGVEDAQKKQEEHEKDKKDAVQNAVNKATEHADKREEEHKKEMKDAVQKAVKKAVEEARQAHQQQLEDERQSSREAQVKATKVENDLRTEIGDLKSQVEQGTESKSGNPAGAQPNVIANELIVQTREADEANNLLLEIGRNGIAQDSVEHVIVHELSNAKLALYNLKYVLRKRGLDVVRDELVFMIASGKVNEQNIQQVNATTWAELVKQAKWAQVRLQKVEDILAATSDLQKDKILEAIDAPWREIRKARGSKRHTNKALGTLPPNLQTDVQVAIPISTLQTPSNTVRGSASDQGVPGSTKDGRSSLTPQRQEDQSNGALCFNLRDIDRSNPVWDGVNFNVHNEGSGETAKPQGSANAESSSAQHTPFTGSRFDIPQVATNNVQSSQSMDRSMQAKRDHRQSFADILASLKPPASSETTATAVVPEPGSNNDNSNIASNTPPPDVPAKTLQSFSAGEPLPLPGLVTNSGTDDAASAPWSDGGRTNALLGSTQARQTEPEELVIHTQQGGSVDSTQQECLPDQPKGWTIDMTTSVEALLENGHTSVDRIITVLEDEYENFSAIEGVEDYIQKLKNQNEDWIPDMPVGWTDSMTEIARDMLNYGDDVDLIVDFMKEDTALQTIDIKCLEQWVKKLQSDYETELKSRPQQD